MCCTFLIMLLVCCCMLVTPVLYSYSVGPADMQTVFDPKAAMAGFGILRLQPPRGARWSAGNRNSEFAGQIGRTGPTENI
jgi:hypothetical protein